MDTGNISMLLKFYSSVDFLPKVSFIVISMNSYTGTKNETFPDTLPLKVFQCCSKLLFGMSQILIPMPSNQLKTKILVKDKFHL